MTRPRVREDATQLPTTRRTACPEFGGLLGLDGGDPQQPHELTVGVVIRSGIPGPCLPPGRSPAAATYRPGSSVRARLAGGWWRRPSLRAPVGPAIPAGPCG